MASSFGPDFQSAQRAHSRKRFERAVYTSFRPPDYDAARLVVRADLDQPGKEIERAILYWEREARENG